MASEYECSSGECVQPDARCNGTTECLDGSDESHCPCKRDEFRCTDGSCINIALRCDGNKHCRPLGEDEINCGEFIENREQLYSFCVYNKLDFRLAVLFSLQVVANWEVPVSVRCKERRYLRL